MVSLPSNTSFEVHINIIFCTAISRKYTHFLSHLTHLSLLDAISLKPLLDGKTLAKAIGTPPGPWMKDALDIVMAWQLRNPSVTDPTEAIEAVKAHRAGELKNDLIRHFLKLTIRPLFLKAPPPSNITPQGRKLASEPLPRKLGIKAMETPAWKLPKEGYVIDILRWVVANLEGKIVGEVWPLVVPPLMTLLDDWEMSFKAKGAELVGGLMRVVEPELLARTGLGEVFGEALMGCLVYLPPTSDEGEAIQLLGAVYPALVALARVRYSAAAADGDEKLSPQDIQRQRTKFLDKILRDGILYGITHCNTHPKILILLFEQLALFLDELGIESVKHIKHSLPLLSETLSHPLGTASLPMLQRATEALQALIRNCWPRMGEYRGEVLKGVTLCCLGVESDPAAAELQASLKNTVVLLREAISGQQCDWQADCEMLIEADGRLKGLLEAE